MTKGEETSGEEPLMPRDSVLRRIDDDLALAERRAMRELLLGDAVDDLLTAGEVMAERARQREAQARGEQRLRRQITSGLGFGAWPGGVGERIRTSLLLLLALAALFAVIWLIGTRLGA